MKVWHNVYPRYTPGSPAQVPPETAEHVATEEALCHQRALSGIYGEEEQAFAKKAGLHGIVFTHAEHGRKVIVQDLITRVRHNFPTFDAFRTWSEAQRKVTLEHRH